MLQLQELKKGDCVFEVCGGREVNLTIVSDECAVEQFEYDGEQLTRYILMAKTDEGFDVELVQTKFEHYGPRLYRRY
jgi:hypothetical protein